MKKQTFYAILFLIVAFGLSTYNAYGQEGKKPHYIIKGNKLEKVKTPKKKPVKTNWTIAINDTILPVWKGTKGSYFLLRTSKNTGNKYRQYLRIEEETKN